MPLWSLAQTRQSLARHWKAERSFIVFLLCFGFFRTAMADWNPVPSGSMRPTILEGDVVLVNRLAYDFKLPLTDIVLARLGEPQRGDIVTFSSPKDGVRLIKRLVALPGDTVELREGRLVLNGQEVALSETHTVTETVDMAGPGRSQALKFQVNALRAQELLPGRPHAVQYYHRANHNPSRNFGPVRVPAGHYFMLGDNRDNSEDSRFIGFVPRNALIGRASRTLVSADILSYWQPRLERVLAPLV
jgi:signal peptidase I